MVGKKGMSPIIATILLIAFAVALGAMIMNWSSTLVAEGEKASLCEAAAVKVREPLCFKDNKIRVNVVNTGENEISALILRIVSPDFEQDIQIKNSEIGRGDVLRREVPAIKPENSEISLVPMVPSGDHGSAEACSNPVHTTPDVPNCE